MTKLEEFIGVYIVSPDGTATRERGHTLKGEALITLKRERERLKERAGWAVVLRREQWAGNEMVSVEEL